MSANFSNPLRSSFASISSAPASLERVAIADNETAAAEPATVRIKVLLFIRWKDGTQPPKFNDQSLRRANFGNVGRGRSKFGCGEVDDEFGSAVGLAVDFDAA